MKRPALLLIAACMALLACSLSGSSPDAGSPTESVSGGGVPIAKSTPTPAESAPSATQPPQVSTSAPSPVPTEAGTTPLPPAQGVPLEVVDLNAIDEGEGLGVVVFGLARNIGQRDLNYAQITVQFLSEPGEIVSSRIGIIASRILPAGDVAPFRVLFPENVGADAERIEVDVFWRESSPDFDWKRGGMEVVNSSGTALPNIGYHVSGELRNNSAARIEQVNLIILAFDAQGHFLGFGDFADESGFDPGASLAFDRPINLLEYAESVARYEFIVETKSGQ
ncbi:MAG TPA: FxLYD domain-containing protein [Anaerolineales bacterium]|nr:FxLYD domain-containing protein [Anaerolineales bacterium]